MALLMVSSACPVDPDAKCGNGVLDVDEGEECDWGRPNGEDYTLADYPQGAPCPAGKSCGTSCICHNGCGNGVLEKPPEECDPSVPNTMDNITNFDCHPEYHTCTASCDCVGISGTGGNGGAGGSAGCTTSRAAALATTLGASSGAICAAWQIVEIAQIVHSAIAVAAKAVANDHTTIGALAPLRYPIAQATMDALFNDSTFECGAGSEGYTICPSAPASMPAGDYLVLFNVVKQNVPLDDPSNIYQYGFVFDADGNASNNYQPPPAYANDFFTDTDRWYEADYSPGAGWSIKVSDASGGSVTEIASDARIIISEDVLVLVVPAAEFAVPNPSFRVTAFRHVGDYGMNPPYDWDGSVWPAVADGLAPFP